MAAVRCVATRATALGFSMADDDDQGPEAMARQMLEQLQRAGMGSRIGDGRGDEWRRNGNGDGPIG